jgi:DNA end-binding protein Ku
MPPHPVAPGTISFGLVAIPVKLYSATTSQSVSFNLLHAACGSRIRQQTFCPTCNTVVERADLVRGYEVSRDQYVRVTDDELRSLEGEASRTIDIAEFVPLEHVDPIYFEKTYYLGPEKGGEKPYRLLAEAMRDSKKVALATFVMRGKESLVLIRAAGGGLMLHTMFFADEVRNFGEISKGEGAEVRPNELTLATRLIEGLSTDEFAPDRYRDAYRERVLELIQQKAEGREVSAAPPPAGRPQVIDLVQALEASLAKKPPRQAVTAIADKKPLARAKRQEPAATPARRAQAGRK